MNSFFSIYFDEMKKNGNILDFVDLEKKMESFEMVLQAQKLQTASTAKL